MKRSTLLAATRYGSEHIETNRRERILRGAVETLHAHPGGSGAADIRAIARHTSLPEPTVRALFPDEPALWRGILDWIHRRLMLILEHQAVRHRCPLQALERVFRGHIAFLSRHPAIPAVILNRARCADPQLRERVRCIMEAYEAGLAELIGQAKARGLLDARTDPKAAAAQLLTTIIGLVVRAPLSGDGSAADWLKREAERFWPRYLNGLMSSQPEEFQ